MSYKAERWNIVFMIEPVAVDQILDSKETKRSIRMERNENIL
jgi:hypothetical protein